jgi:hypothetical protein
MTEWILVREVSFGKVESYLTSEFFHAWNFGSMLQSTNFYDFNSMISFMDYPNLV